MFQKIDLKYMTHWSQRVTVSKSVPIVGVVTGVIAVFEDNEDAASAAAKAADSADSKS